VHRRTRDEIANVNCFTTSYTYYKVRINSGTDIGHTMLTVSVNWKQFHQIYNLSAVEDKD